MILGIGVDVCGIARIRHSLARSGDRLLRKVLTDDELAYCQRHADVATTFAGRFAAKEAATKALGAPPGLSWQDFAVQPAAPGRPPTLVLSGGAHAAGQRLGLRTAYLSISHDATGSDGGVAVAMVVLET